MKVISVGELHQENICCLNTSLLGKRAVLHPSYTAQYHLRGDRISCSFPAVLVLARRRQQLRAVLGAIQGLDTCSPASPSLSSSSSSTLSSSTTSATAAALPNYLSLLLFWQEYYTQRGRDCQSLEISSRVPFAEWLSTCAAAIAGIDDLMALHGHRPSRVRKRARAVAREWRVTASMALIAPRPVRGIGGAFP